jgi:hypothetical protein
MQGLVLLANSRTCIVPEMKISAPPIETGCKIYYQGRKLQIFRIICSPRNEPIAYYMRYVEGSNAQLCTFERTHLMHLIAGVPTNIFLFSRGMIRFSRAYVVDVSETESFAEK